MSRIAQPCQQHLRPTGAAPIEHLQFDVAVNRYEMDRMRRFVSVLRLSRWLLFVGEAFIPGSGTAAGEGENNYHCYQTEFGSRHARKFILGTERLISPPASLLCTGRVASQAVIPLGSIPAICS